MPETGPDLACVGNLTVDEVVAADGSSTSSAGGDALFAALAARLTGGRPRVVAPVGTDLAEELRDALALVGADAASLPQRAAPTIRNRVSYGADGRRQWTLLTGEENFETMSVHPSDVSSEVLAADGILLSAMGLRAQLELAAWLRPRTAATIYFDPQEDYVAGHEPELLAAVAACDVFLPSAVEAEALAGTSDPVRAAHFFLGCGPTVVVVKQAELGCLVATRDATTAVPADVVAATDSTGAGDAFCGAFAARHLSSADPVAAAEAGARAAKLAVSGHGVSGLLAALRSRHLPRPVGSR